MSNSVCFVVRYFLILFASVAIFPIYAKSPLAVAEGAIDIPSPVYVEFRNSEQLTAKVKTLLTGLGVEVLDSPKVDVPRLSIYGYHSSRDTLGRPGVVDLGRLYEGLLHGAITQSDTTRTRGSSVMAAQEAGKILGSAAHGAYASLAIDVLRNMLDTPEEGAQDAYHRRRFLAQSGVNVTQIWGVLIPAGVAPFLAATPKSGVLRINVSYDDAPADPVLHAVDSFLSALLSKSIKNESK